MTEEKLKELNELAENIDNSKKALETIKDLEREYLEILPRYVEHNYRYRLNVPQELCEVFVPLLEDYYKKRLMKLENEFKEM